MTYEKSCGAIVVRRNAENIEILLIRSAKNGHWSFPKGHVEPGESERQTAKREIMEETSIDVEILPHFREVMTYSPKEGVQKDVVYFLASPKNTDFAPQQGEIAQVSWVNMAPLPDVLTYDNDKQLFVKAETAIRAMI